jgi:hypothetical protein
LTGELKWVVGHFQNFELVLQLFEVRNWLIMLSELVLSERKDIQICESFKTFQLFDLICEQAQVSKLSESSKALNLLNQVETKIKPLQID